MGRSAVFALALVVAVSFTARADTSTPPAGQTKVAAAPSGPPSVLATLQRTACFGTCPVYKVTLYTDGRVVFEGEHFIKARGRHEGLATPAAIAAVRKAVADANYLALDEHYDCYEVTDNPSANTSFNDAGHHKSITHYYGCPKAPKGLFTVEHAIDEAAQVEKWVGTQKEREKLRAAGKLN
jgi:hypothetical protein